MKATKLLTVAALQAVALGSTAQAIAPTVDTQAPVEQLNQVSLQSIESSWLRMPTTCKAKGFFAEPSVIQEAQSQAALCVFAAFDRASA